MNKRYTCEQVAEMYGVSVQRIWAWIRDGRLPAIRLNEGYRSKYRVREEDLVAFEAERLTANIIQT